MYYGSDDTYMYELTLTPDWNYHLFCISQEDYSPHEGYHGSFTETEWTDEYQAYNFTRVYRMWAGDEDFEYDYKSVTGTAKALVKDITYELHLTGSDAIPASGLTIYQEDIMER